MCSKKTSGIALLVIGFILVALGVIIGLMLPNKAQTTVEDNVCVDSKDSPGYDRWEGPTDYISKVYIWNITNKQGFLYRGETPKLVERGPYVYSMVSKKVGVRFKKGQVTSKSFEQAKFNKTLTEKECETCREDDKLTVLNAAYLGLMAEAGTADNFGTAFIPLVLNLLFLGLNSTTKSLNATLLEMGKTQNRFPLNPTYNPAFGSWLNSIPNFTSPQKNFTLIEMKGLYGPLLNASQFGPFTNQVLLSECKGGNLTIECGLSINFWFLTNASLATQAAGFIGKLLCPDPASACFDTSNSQLSLQTVELFVRDLSKYVMWYLDNNNYGLTTTRNQSEITLGYLMEKLPLPEYKNGIPVPGAVTSHAKESDVKTSSTFYTCESTDGERFTYAAINGQSQVPKNLYPNATPEQLKIRGYYTQFPGVKSLKACSTKFTPLANSYELFISQFLFAVPITYKEDVEIHDIPMHKYGLEKSALEVNNVTIFTRGVFDVSRVFKSPIRMSLPGFLYGDPSLYQDLNLSTPDEGKYESFLSIEPISGTAMQLKLRLQLNGQFLKSALHTSYPETKNVTFVDKPIPISWVETEASIDQESAEEYSSQLFGGLRLACGLLVALPVIGGILVILGVAFIVLGVKKADSVTAA